MGREVVYKTISMADFSSVGICLDVSLVNDSLKVVGGTRGGEKLDMKQLPDILYALGIQNDEHLEVMEKCFHRTLQGKVVEDYRIVGRERNDKEWILSGYASDEVKLSTSKMRDMVSYASMLKNGGG